MTSLMRHGARPTTHSAPTSTLQRACACGQHTAGGGECASCKQKRLQRSAAGAGPSVAPPIVHEVLGSGGQPLDAATRGLMEPRFGRDFGGVRVHTDAQAAESARAVGALAYTVGGHIAFGAGQYAPHTGAGRRLLAHELAHTVQQGGGSPAVQRLAIGATDTPDERAAERAAEQVSAGDRVEVGERTGPAVQRYVPCAVVTMSGADCPVRAAGEVERARSNAMFVGAVSGPVTGMIVANFAVGQSRLKPDLAANAYFTDYVRQMESHHELRWEILGFSDCQGEDRLNESLRLTRARAIYNALSPTARSRVTRVAAAPLSECMDDNGYEGGRSLNRSALIRQVGAEFDFEAEEIEVERADFVCGPDVTRQVSQAVADTSAVFSGWTADERTEACDALDSLSSGAYAWDIVDLHNNAWIYQNYRPICATSGAEPPCGSTVQVEDDCHYAGSANYVIFGRMCKLCFNHFISHGPIHRANDFTRSSMRSLIDLYKGTGVTGLASPSGNFAASVAWANAGYSGWPSAAAPEGDRPNCQPLCPTPYRGPRFRVNWHPHQFFTGDAR